jgi:hypothetical protein
LRLQKKLENVKQFKSLSTFFAVLKELMLALGLEYIMFPCRATNSYFSSRLCFRVGSVSWQPAWQDEAALPLHPRLDGFPGLHERLLFQVGLAPWVNYKDTEPYMSAFL